MCVRPRLATALLGALCLLLGACASLPPPKVRPAEHALAWPAATQLGKRVRDLAPDTTVSGVRLLVNGQDALDALLVLAQQAQRTLDLQYYIVKDDDSSRRVLDAVERAAARGVRVRLLVDDLNAADASDTMRCLAHRPNVQLRLYNPLPAGRFSTATRILASLTDLSRINQRMHAKMFVADNAVASAGGRNLGDAYFVRSAQSNFLDLDLLLAGPAVRALSRSFDRFWNDRLAYPIDELELGEPNCPSAEQTPAGVPARGELPATPRMAVTLATPVTSAAQDVFRDATPGVSALGLESLHWTAVQVLSDSPAKIVETPDAGSVQIGQALETDAQTSAASARSSLTATSGSADDPMRSVLEAIAQRVGRARERVTVITPYFVPGPHGLAAVRALRERGVLVRVLTNSLAATDAPVVHIGYARYRRQLLELGVELYELPNRFGRKRAVLRSFGESLASLHAKALTIDGRTAIVGSMNMDPRSRWLNTELGVILPDAELAAQIEGLFEHVAEDSFRLELSSSGAIRWIGPQSGPVGTAGDKPGNGPQSAPRADPRVDLGSEPGASLGLRALLLLLRPFAPDEML